MEPPERLARPYLPYQRGPSLSMNLAAKWHSRLDFHQRNNRFRRTMPNVLGHGSNPSKWLAHPALPREPATYEVAALTKIELCANRIIKLEHHFGLPPNKSRFAIGCLVSFGIWCIMAGVTEPASAISTVTGWRLDSFGFTPNKTILYAGRANRICTGDLLVPNEAR